MQNPIPRGTVLISQYHCNLYQKKMLNFFDRRFHCTSDWLHCKPVFHQRTCFLPLSAFIVMDDQPLQLVNWRSGLNPWTRRAVDWKLVVMWSRSQVMSCQTVATFFDVLYGPLPLNGTSLEVRDSHRLPTVLTPGPVTACCRTGLERGQKE